MKTVQFYQMAVALIGYVPDTLKWLYDLTTVFLVISTFCVFIIPISILFKKAVN